MFAPTPVTAPLPRSSLLKLPRQPRSVAMIHRILDAAMELLETEGSAAFTANRVAERAGISPGSLYQYFANKEMILAGIIERSVIETEQLIQQTFLHSRGVAIETLVESLFGAIAASLEPYREVVREIFTGVPLLADTSVPAMLERTFLDALRNYLVLNQDDYRLEGGLAAMWVSVNSGILLFLKWMVDRPATFTDEEFFAALARQVSNPIRRRTERDKRQASGIKRQALSAKRRGNKG